MEFKIAQVIKHNGMAVKRYIVFTGDREGRIETEAGLPTCLFSFETFSNITFKSLKNGETYQTKLLPTDHVFFSVVGAIHGAYIKRRERTDYAA